MEPESSGEGPREAARKVRAVDIVVRQLDRALASRVRRLRMEGGRRRGRRHLQCSFVGVTNVGSLNEAETIST